MLDDELIRQQRRAVRNMPPVVTCDNCGLTYYQTSAPHVCAGWTTKEEKMNRNATGYPVIDQILESIAPSDDTKRIMDTPVEEWCECKHALYNHGEDDFSPQKCNVIGCECENFAPATEHEPIARGGENDGSKRYPLSEIEHFITENERLRRALDIIGNSYWSENEPYSEQVEHLQQLAKDALNDQKGE